VKYHHLIAQYTNWLKISYISIFVLVFSACGGGGGGDVQVEGEGPIVTSNPTLTLNDASLSEGNNGTRLLNLIGSLSAASDQEVSFNYVTENGTAIGDEDFVAVSTPQTLTIPAGNTSFQVTITINGDTRVEVDENFTVRLSSPQNVDLARTSATATIVNDDLAVIMPQLILNNASINEGNDGSGLLQLTGTLSGASDRVVSFDYITEDGTAVGGEDFMAVSAPQTLTIPAGNTSFQISITINGDTVVESNEIFTVKLSSPQNVQLTNTSATATIINDDSGAVLPQLILNNASTNEGNDGSSLLQLTGSLSGAFDQDVSFNYVTENGTAVGGEDFVAVNAPQTLTIPAGNTSFQVSITINGDTTVEQDEIFTVKLSSPQNVQLTNTSATATIINDDSASALPQITLNNTSMNEGNNGTSLLQLNGTLNKQADQVVTFNYMTTNGTATAGEDFVGISTPETYSIAAGETNFQLEFTINGDESAEADEIFTVVLSSPQNAELNTESATVTIVNDDQSGASDFIVVDQFGYLIGRPKVAVIRNPQVGYDSQLSYVPGTNFSLYNVDTNSVIFSADIEQWNNGSTDDSSGDSAWWFDFSSVETPGTYHVIDNTNNAQSADFKIGDDVYKEVLKHAVRTFYYQRAGMAKTQPYAGEGWTDGASHLGAGQDPQARLYNAPDDASTERDLRGGWYDAGDYNKYTNWTADYVIGLLHAYIENPSVWTDDFNIPESGNGIPDLLDEIKWGLDWLVRMQNDDGSVLSIVGVADRVSPPSAATEPSYYGTASTASTVTSASAYALASKIFAASDNSTLQTYAVDLAARAKNAWDWSIVNPSVQFRNNDESQGTSGLGSGQQEPNNDAEGDKERAMKKVAAAIYLFDLTGEQIYKDYVDNNYGNSDLIGNSYVSPFRAHIQRALLYYSTLANASITTANNIRSGYISAMSDSDPNWRAFDNDSEPYAAFIQDYVWGSNSTKSRKGSMFYQWITYDLDQNNDSGHSNDNAKDAALNYLHYLHGRNPLNFVYLSNMNLYGATNSVTTFYHEWFAEGSALWDSVGGSTYGPAPGFLTGGPNPYFGVEALSPPYGQPAQKSYLDFNTIAQNTWEITENSNGYQVDYIRLLSKFVKSVNGNVGGSGGSLDLGVDNKLQIHTIGDSITEAPGWRARLYYGLNEDGVETDFIGSSSDQYPESPEIENDGHGGFTTGDILGGVDGWLAGILKPELTIIMIGTNDMAWWTVEPMADVVSRINDIINKVIANAPQGHVIIASIAPQGGGDLPTTVVPNGRDRTTLVNELNAGIANLVSQRQTSGDSIDFVNVNAVLTTVDLYDGIHPNDAGHVKMGNAFLVKVRELLDTAGNGFPNIGNSFGDGPLQTSRAIFSGHSLLDNPIPSDVLSIANSLSVDFNYNMQNLSGSLLRERTIGWDPNVIDWSGYSLGTNRNGSGLNIAEELRNPQTIGSGEQYTSLVVTERHEILTQIENENTIPLLKHFHDRLIEGNNEATTYFYQSWLSIDKNDPQPWIYYEKAAVKAWECSAAKANLVIDNSSRRSILALPAGYAFAHLVEKALAGEVAGISGTELEIINEFFTDNVHPTRTTAYYMGLVNYIALYKHNPTGAELPFGMSAETGNALQTIAWDLISNYYMSGSGASEPSMQSCQTALVDTLCESYWNLLSQPDNISSCQTNYAGTSEQNKFLWPDPFWTEFSN